MTGQRVDARCAAQALVDDHLIWVRGPIRAPASTIVATSSRRIIDSNYCLSPQAQAFNHGLLGIEADGQLARHRVHEAPALANRGPLTPRPIPGDC